MIKRVLLTQFVINTTLYALVYFIKSFVIWKLTNPFNWIIEIPNYNGSERGAILFAVVIWQSIVWAFSISFAKHWIECNRDANKL